MGWTLPGRAKLSLSFSLGFFGRVPPGCEANRTACLGVKPRCFFTPASWSVALEPLTMELRPPDAGFFAAPFLLLKIAAAETDCFGFAGGCAGLMGEICF